MRYFVATSIAFVAWWWVNSWWCSSTSRIAFATKASFVVPRSLTQESKKIKLHSNVKMQTMFFLLKKYGNILPINDFGIMIVGYCIHFFDSIAFIRLQCPISSAPCNFQRLYISNSTWSNCLNKVFILFKVRPCTLWDEPHPPMPESQWCPTRSRRLNVPIKAI